MLKKCTPSLFPKVFDEKTLLWKKGPSRLIHGMPSRSRQGTDFSLLQVAPCKVTERVVEIQLCTNVELIDVCQAGGGRKMATEILQHIRRDCEDARSAAQSASQVEQLSTVVNSESER